MSPVAVPLPDAPPKPPRIDAPAPPPPDTAAASSHYDPLTSTTRPLESATITVRIIKSFEYRTQKALVLKELNLKETTVQDLIDRCVQAIKTAPGFKPYRTLQLDTLKLYTQAHSHKTMNLIINLDHEDWILNDKNKTLAEYGVVNETELSLFNRELYEAFKEHPDLRWD